ncbi:hypothetical protein CR513_39555, partial [Mucuna pruriens]
MGRIGRERKSGFSQGKREKREGEKKGSTHIVLHLYRSDLDLEICGMRNRARTFKEDTSLSDHLNEFQGIIDQMSRMGIKFEDEILGLLLLNSLPESWETFKVSITNSTPNGVVSLQMVKGSVLNKEMRRKTQGSSSQSEVLVTENRGRSQKREREKSRSKSKFRYKNVECHYYYKTGHIQKHCFLWKKENKGKKGKSKEKDDDDDHDHDRVTTAIGDDLVILRDFELVNFVSDESMWIIDSGATLHIRVSFKKHPPSRKLELLELVHSDVCGPLK